MWFGLTTLCLPQHPSHFHDNKFITSCAMLGNTLSGAAQLGGAAPQSAANGGLVWPNCRLLNGPQMWILPKRMSDAGNKLLRNNATA
jgi:hypothetical protein